MASNCYIYFVLYQELPEKASTSKIKVEPIDDDDQEKTVRQVVDVLCDKGT